MTKGKVEPAIDRFSVKYEVTQSGCWEWLAGINAKGYGTFTVATGRKGYAHRWAYEHFVGPIGAGMEIDHLCRNRRCVNPAHLEAVTPRENQRRGISPAGLNSRRTTCIRGHLFDDQNTYWRPDGGGRVCRACQRLRAARQSANPPAQPATTIADSLGTN